MSIVAMIGVGVWNVGMSLFLPKIRMAWPDEARFVSALFAARLSAPSR